MIALSAVRNRQNEVYSVNSSCWQGATKGTAESGLTTRGIIKGISIVGCFHLP
jgi:hypothetical protein